MVGFVMKLAKKDYSDVLIQFCILVAFPALILQKLYPLQLHMSDLSVIAIAIYSIFFGFIAGFVLSRFLHLEKKSASVVILACGLGNTSFVGFPFVEALYGEDAIGYALLFDQFGSFLVLSIFGSLVAAWGAGRDSSIKKLATNIFLFPPFVAIIVSLFLKFFELPTIVLSGVDKLADVLLPVATIAVGMKIDIRHIKENINQTTAILIVKMGVVPLAVLAVLPSIGVAAKVSLIEAAMPPMVMVAVFATKYGLNERLAVSAIAVGIFASFVSIPLFYYLG